MPLDPGIAGLLELIENAGYPPMHEGDAATAVPVDVVARIRRLLHRG